MLFNSFEFAFFLPVVVVAYYLTPARYRWGLLLAASYYFYASWRVTYLGLILASTLVDYWAGLQMGTRDTRRARRPFLIASLVVNLGLLGAFKYFNFFSTSVQAAFDRYALPLEAPLLDVLLPVGISFYTFQTLAYAIDVYRGRMAPERHLGYFALYVSFFPQLVAGPIERAQHLLPQLRARHRFRYDDVTWGLVRMAYGFFKKLVVADRLGLYVDAVYGNLGAASSVSVALATFFFAIQIYCDFSGYSDIAIGAARLLGIDLMENFRRPYLARSLREFWSRWHISLSTWFRDYLYIPLGGNRVPKWRWLANLMIVFVISGLWHGANWTFLAWGALHGFYLIAGLLTAPLRERGWALVLGTRQEEAVYAAGLLAPRRWLRPVVSTAWTFLLVLVAWVFFRADSVEAAWYALHVMARADLALHPGTLFAGLGPLKFLLNLAVIGLLLLSYRLPLDLRIRHRTPFLIATTLLIILLGTDAGEQFIYFQF